MSRDNWNRTLTSLDSLHSTNDRLVSRFWRRIRCLLLLQGDSGGPLVKVENGQWTLYGVVSWGYECAADEHPTLYAKVINYLDWIEQTITDNS